MMSRSKRRATVRKRSIALNLNQVEKELGRPKNSVVALVIIIILALIMVGLVWQKVKVSQLIQEIDQLEKQLVYYKETNEKLQGQVLSLSNETRIVSIAREKLDMIYPPYEFMPIKEKIKVDELETNEQ
ncbi:cell division protein FtsL [candidate division KSB1 bacterium]|nr:cell division protein FtsL [candidate division KSB1 bacterium]